METSVTIKWRKKIMSNEKRKLDAKDLDQAAGGSMRKKSVCNSKKAFSSYS
jgi:hypothetical protein